LTRGASGWRASGGPSLPRAELSGEKTALILAYDAVSDSAAGAGRGRNVLHPEAMLAAVDAVVHKNAEPKEAPEIFNSLKAKH
jgi:DhnA family fructose-bisphosphate aldolase class Ia